MGNSLSASPKKESVEKSLSSLYDNSKKKRSRRVKVIDVDLAHTKFIIFSDQHKGNRSGADDFLACEKNYTSALQGQY